MPDAATAEHKGKTEAQKKQHSRFLDAKLISQDFNRQNFETAVRMYHLWAGHLPPELEGTYSQLMLRIAYATVDEEIPLNVKAWTAGEHLTLTAEDIMLEPDRKTAEKWLKYQLEKVQNLPSRLIAPFQSAFLFGGGYRMYKHHFHEEVKMVRVPNVGLMGIVEPDNEFVEVEQRKTLSTISGEYLNYFNVMPSPVGTQINPQAGEVDSQLDWLFVRFYPLRSWIESELANGNFDKAQTKLALSNKNSGDDNDTIFDYTEQIKRLDGGWTDFNQPAWARIMKGHNEELKGRIACDWWFHPAMKEWMLVADNQFILYQGKPLLNWIPIAHFKPCPDMDSFHGFSLIELVEDIIISRIQNFSMRLDTLAWSFHPATFYPRELIDDLGGDIGRLDRKPFNILPYNHQSYQQGGGLAAAIHIDRPEALTEQAYIEEGTLERFQEDILAQRSNESLRGETATVGSSLIDKSNARPLMRALNMDMSGVENCATLTMKYGDKYKNETELINTGADGMPWEEINHKAITDGYGITINGTRRLAQAEERFKKILTVTPFLVNNPHAKGQTVLAREVARAGQFDNPDAIIDGDQSENPMNALNQTPGMPGGVPDFRNDARSQMNRNEVQANTGAVSAAGAAAI